MSPLYWVGFHGRVTPVLFSLSHSRCSPYVPRLSLSFVSLTAYMLETIYAKVLLDVIIAFGKRQSDLLPARAEKSNGNEYG